MKPHFEAPTSPELRRTLKRQIVLALAVLPAVVGLVLWWLPREGAASALLRGYAAVAVAVVVGWWLALGLRRLLWRVGRRLAFSYFLIGVVPIPLIALLALVAAYVMNGFFLGHLYRDALSSTATDLRLAVETRFEQLSRGWTPPEPGAVPLSYAYYHDGHKLGGDPRAPRLWQDWWVAGTFETPVPSPLGPQFVALADGRPTLVAAVSQGGYGLLALYDGDLERDLSERSGVWVELVRSDSGERAIAFTFQQRDYALRLPRLGRESEELKAFFHPGDDDPGFYRRPALLWAEISRPFLDLASGEPATDYVYATLTGSLETIFYHLISRSAEVDTFAYLVFFALAFALFDIWVLAALMAILMISGLSRAVNRLSRATERVRQGDFSTRIEVRRTDQIGELQLSFNQMAENLETLVASATQKELLEKELEIARELQRSLLPHELAGDEALSFATHFAPSAAIGGDYYDVLPVCRDGDGGERLAVVVADVSGHGLSAGLRMAMVKSALQLLCEQESCPREIMSRLDRLLRPRSGLQRSSRGFVTATLALVDRDGGELVITNAGHSPTYLWRRGRVTEIVLPSPPLGALGLDFGQQTVALEPGDAVIWLSDGMIEATDGEDPFGYDGIVLALEEVAADVPHDATALRDHLLRALEEHTGGRLPDDDRTLVVMVYRPVATPVATPGAKSSAARSSEA